MTNTILTTQLNAIIDTVPTNVESPVPSQPRLSARAHEIWGEGVQVRISHTRHNAQATAEINAYKSALVKAFKAAGYSVLKVRGAGLRYMYCSSIGNPKDGLAWDLELRS